VLIIAAVAASLVQGSLIVAGKWHVSNLFGALADILFAFADPFPLKPVFALLAGAFIWLWWNRRPPDKRKTLRELGAKSRARLAALVDAMRPVPSPTYQAP
jgi:hypothetical protein